MLCRLWSDQGSIIRQKIRITGRVASWYVVLGRKEAKQICISSMVRSQMGILKRGVSMWNRIATNALTIRYYKYKHHCDWLSLDCLVLSDLTLLTGFVSRCVNVAGKAGSRRHASVAGSHGPAKPAFCRYRQGKLVMIFFISFLYSSKLHMHKTIIYIYLDKEICSWRTQIGRTQKGRTQRGRTQRGRTQRGSTQRGSTQRGKTQMKDA